MSLATVPVITLPAHEARRHFLSYRRAVRERHTAEDAALMRGYRALAQGQRVLDVRAALGHGGLDERGLPRLALAQAGAARCWVRYRSSGGVTFVTREDAFWRARVAAAVRVSFREDTLPRWHEPQRSVREGVAFVPTVPAGLRPHARLDAYRILWEATWTPLPRPGDPMLLKPVGCGLYVVVAVWDMTPIEAAVLGWRR